MEGWLYTIHPKRLRLHSSRKKYFMLHGNTLICFKSPPTESKEEPVKTVHINPCIRVADNGRENVYRKVLFVFTLYDSSNHDDNLKLGARSSEEAARWMHFLKEAALQAQPCQEDRLLIYSKNRRLSSRSSTRKESALLRTTADLRDWTGWLSIMQPTADVVAPSPWRIFGCENGLRLFEEARDGEFKSKCWGDHRAVMAVGVVDATCESIFETVMALGPSRLEWDFCYLRGKVIEHLDGHTDIVHKQFHSNWLPWGLTPRDLLLLRYWRREDDGSYVILYHSVEHRKCPPCHGFVRACIKSGGYVISPLTRPQQHASAVVKHMLAVDWKYWKSYLRSSCERNITLKMLGRIAAMREMFKAKLVHYPCSELSSCELINENATNQMDGRHVKEDTSSMTQEEQSSDVTLQVHDTFLQANDSAGSFLQFSDAMDEFIDAPEDLNHGSSALDSDQCSEQFIETEGYPDYAQVSKCQSGGPNMLSTAAVFVKRLHELASAAQKRSQVDTVGAQDDADFLSYEATLPKNSACTLPSSWAVADPATFLIRGKSYLQDRQKIKAKDTLMRMVAADWLRSDKREDNLAGRPECFIQRRASQGGKEFFFVVNIQVPGATTYSLALYYMMDCPIENVPLLENFVKGDDAYRNSRFKIIPHIAKGSWIVKQSVGKTACLVGQALEINYPRGSNYLELDVNIGSSSVAKGVVNLVLGYLSKLVIEMAFVIQANTEDELPEFLLGTCRLNHLDASKSIPADQKYSQAA